MKILYTANERNDAQLAAPALRSIARDVALAWAGSLHDAQRWVSENQDLGALVVDAQVQSQSSARLVGYVRGLGLTAPILVVAPEDGEPPLAALKAGADDYVIKSQSFVADLTAMLRRSLRQPHAQTRSRPLRLLYIGDAALARGSLDRARCSIEITEAAPGANGLLQPISWDPGSTEDALPFDVLMIEHDHPGMDTFAILKDVVRRERPLPVILVVEWDEELALPALKLGATDCVVKNKAAFRALFFRLDRHHQEHVDGPERSPHKDLKEAEANWDAVAVDAATEQRLEQQVREAQAVARATEQRLNALNATTERLRESEARLQATIQQERANREELEQKLAKADGARQRAEQLRAAAAARYDQTVQQASESSSQLVQAIRSRDTLAEQLKQAAQALQQVEENRAAEAAAAAENLLRWESKVAAAKAEAVTTRESLERRLTDAQRALQEIEERVSTERAAGQQISERQADFEARFNREVEQRVSLAKKLADAEAALHVAERRFASEMAATAEQGTERQSQHETALARLKAEREALEQKLVETDQRDEAFAISLTRVVHSRDALEQRLNDTVMALERAHHDHTTEVDAAAERLARRETELAEAAEIRRTLERRLALAESSLRDRDADVEATTERLTRREAQLAEATETRQTLESRLAETGSALHEAIRRSEDERSAAQQQVAQRQLEFEAAQAEEVARYRTLDLNLVATREKLARTETTLHEAKDRHAAAMAMAAAQLNEQQARYEALLQNDAAARDAADQQLREVTATLENVRQDHLASTTAAAMQLTRREKELAEAVSTRHMLERRLAEAETALQSAEQRATAERVAAEDRAAQRQAEFVARLDLEATQRKALEQTLAAAQKKGAETEAAVRDAEQRHTSEMTTATAQFSDRQRAYEARLIQAAATREAVEQQLRETEASLERSQRERAADGTAAAERLSLREADLAEAVATRQMLEGRLGDAITALQSAEQRATADRLAAEDRAAQRQAEFVARLDLEATQRKALEQTLAAAQKKGAETEAAVRDAEQRHTSEMTTAAAQFSDRQRAYEARLIQAAATREAVEQQLRETEASLERSQRERAADGTAAAERLSLREADLAEAVATRQMLEGRLGDAITALQSAEQRATADRLAAEDRAAQRQAEFVARLDLEATQRKALEQTLAAAQKKGAETEAAIREAEQRHASAMAAATAQFNERRAELETRLTDAASAYAVLERTLADSEQRRTAEMKTAEGQFAKRASEYESRLAQAAAVKDAADRRLAEAEAALEQVRHERAAEAISVAERLTQHEAELAEAAANKETLERRVAEATTALQAAEQRAASDRLASTQEAIERQLEFDARFAQELGTRQTVEQTLAATRQDLLNTEAALREAQEVHSAEMTSAAARLSEQRIEHTTRLAQALAAHAALEQQLVDAERQHASAIQAAATRSIENQRQYDTRLAQAAADRELVDQRLREAEATLERVRQESTSNAVAAAKRLTQRESELAAAAATRQGLERRLTDTETALKLAEEGALAERTMAAQQAAQRSAEFDTRLAQEVRARNTLEQDLAATRTAAEQARQASVDESAALIEQMRNLEARLAAQLARERADYEGKLADQQERLGALSVERDALRQSLATNQERLQDLSRVHEEAKQNFEFVRRSKEAEFERVGHDYGALRQTLNKVRADAVQTLERVTSEHAAELGRIGALVADRDEQMKDQAARHAASQLAGQQTLAKLESELRAALAARAQQVEHLQGELMARAGELEASRSHRDALKVQAERVPDLTNRLDASREENRRQFEQSPVCILRCTRAGALLEANRALITTLGYRTVDELRAVSIAGVFESVHELASLIESGQSTPMKSVDSIWKKKDGSRLIMRLHVVPIADAIEIVAEDLTSLRAVEERLRQAQRMEAVGRLASEVAVTCDTLLTNVSREAQQWLSTVGNNPAQRQKGELIFGEVTRAASFLRQLSVYGEEQSNALEPVDVNRVLRDLEPVLKRLAGDDIEFVLPKRGSALNVDVDAQRVERVLVNVAAYGRARMPSGGRLVVHLDRVTVDSDFVTKYPNVRQGAHALITVTEVRDAARTNWKIGIREAVEGTGSQTSSERPGVDLGTLQALLHDCGGHLWMKAEPGGDMEVKIHLPLRPGDTSKLVGVARSVRERSIGRWFQS